MSKNGEEYEVTDEQVDDASEGSFPASDPPSYSDPAESVGSAAEPADEGPPEEGDDKAS